MTFNRKIVIVIKVLLYVFPTYPFTLCMFIVNIISEPSTAKHPFVKHKIDKNKCTYYYEKKVILVFCSFFTSAIHIIQNTLTISNIGTSSNGSSTWIQTWGEGTHQLDLREYIHFPYKNAIKPMWAASRKIFLRVRL